MSRTILCSLALLLLALPGTGCVQRTLTITSDPDGALVFLNGQEIGRTPVTRDFTWYGTYDVQIRKEGFQTLDEKTPVIAPIWQWPPFDLAAELWPGHLKDQRKLNYTLKPAIAQPMLDPAPILARANELRGKLESPATRPSTHPSTHPAK